MMRSRPAGGRGYKLRPAGGAAILMLMTSQLRSEMMPR
jgi:hypothetical protein